MRAALAPSSASTTNAQTARKTLLSRKCALSASPATTDQPAARHTVSGRAVLLEARGQRTQAGEDTVVVAVVGTQLGHRTASTPPGRSPAHRWNQDPDRRRTGVPRAGCPPGSQSLRFKLQTISAASSCFPRVFALDMLRFDVALVAAADAGGAQCIMRAFVVRSHRVVRRLCNCFIQTCG